MATGRWASATAHEGEQIRGNDFESQRISGSYDTRFGQNTWLTLSARYAENERAGFSG